MAHRHSTSTPQSTEGYTCNNLDSGLHNPSSRSSSRVHRVSILDPVDQTISSTRPSIIQSTFKSPLIYHDDVMPIDDFSSSYTYESHLGRFCKNVVAVSARHPHSFFLQTLDDLTQSDNFFSKMNEFYNRCVDAARLIIPKAALRLNLCCVTRDEREADVWNRAQLLEYHSQLDQCSLLLVDLGTWQECVPRSHLRYILVPFQLEIVRSVPCRLAGIAPAKPEKNGLWNEYAIKTFRKVIENVPTEVEVLDCSPNGSYFVNLFVTHETFVCVNDFLLYHKIAIPVDDSKVLKPDEFDLTTHQPLLAIIYEFKLQGELLAEELKLNERRRKKHEESHQRSLQRQLTLLRLINLPFESLSDNPFIFARYNQWIMVPWFSISILFNPVLSENTIERFAMLYHFSPVYVTSSSNATLYKQLEKYLPTVQQQQQSSTTIALYSIDCVRKLLVIYGYKKNFIFDRLDEARIAEAKNDEEFWFVSNRR